jgi:hypothetical protein
MGVGLLPGLEFLEKKASHTNTPPGVLLKFFHTPNTANHLSF